MLTTCVHVIHVEVALSEKFSVIAMFDQKGPENISHERLRNYIKKKFCFCITNSKSEVLPGIFSKYMSDILG
ncbi:unnamed protein product [Amoebophrya sp. A120]|nr:unnamed protein product [Amoebophrya sp. A120]|eukprot:GSA120T00018160001.1